MSLRYSALTVFGLYLFATTCVFAEIPNALEPEYSEAVLAYNAKKFDVALKILNSLLKKSPSTSEFLELKALSLKANNDTTETATTYDELIRSKSIENKPKKEIAPYHFELGLIRYKEQKFKEAKEHFLFSLDNGFNEGVSHLYLGMMSFKSGNWQESEEHFRGVVAEGPDDIRPAGHFYLAQTYIKTGYPSGATHNFVSARNMSRSLIDDEKTQPIVKKTSEQIRDATDKALAPFDKSQFFGNVTLITGYDSNVIALPSTVTATSETSKKPTFKENVMFGIGYTTSPLRAFQFVPSYRANFTYHFNDLTRSYEFYDHLFSLYVTRDPLAPLNYGLKLEGSLTYKSDLPSPASRTGFKSSLYSKNASLGPYARYEIRHKMMIGAEVFFQPQNFNEVVSSDMRRSGNDFFVRLFFQNDRGSRFFNPSANIRIDKNETKGTEYDARTLSFDVSDIFHLTNSFDTTLSTGFSSVQYGNRASGKRDDVLLNAKALLSYKINRTWSILGSIDYNRNSSNLTTQYSYDRIATSAGATIGF